MNNPNPDIKLLSRQVIDLITAGEVVERPANVVKELIENSLDAKAKNIEIRIEQGGHKAISVSDDGIGIAQNQLHLAALNHATSKIVDLEDLYSKFTLGFRGEALASIRAVSDFIISSRTSESASGWQIQTSSEGDLAVDITEVEPTPMAMGIGTIVVVNNIFQKIPAREKFLRQQATEWRYIRNIVEKFALTNWQVGFSLFHNNKKVFQVAGNDDMLTSVDRLTQFYKIPAGAWCVVTDERADMQLQGWLISPDAQQTNKADIIVSINNRIVTAPEVIRAVNDAYKGLTHGHGDPSGLLYLKIAANNVDVNAHPAKERIRLRYANSVYRFVQQAVHKSFSNYTPNRQVSVTVNPTGETALNENWQTDTNSTDTSSTSSTPNTNISSKQGESPASYLKSPINLKPSTAEALQDTLQAPQNDQDTTNPASEPASNQAEMFDQTQHHLGRVVGQLSGTFILVEGKEGLIVVEMHAAHERILLEQMMQKYHQKKQISNQRYIVPIQMRMHESDVALWEENISMLHQLGIELSVENNSLNIYAMPQMLQFEDAQELIPQITEIFRTEIHSAVSITLEKKTEAIMGNIACKQALKANTSLTHTQMQKFIDEFGSTKRVSWCNHGRPSWNMINYKQLEKICRRGE